MHCFQMLGHSIYEQGKLSFSDDTAHTWNGFG